LPASGSSLTAQSGQAAHARPAQSGQAAHARPAQSGQAAQAPNRNHEDEKLADSHA
jgi:hypothetical protein